MKSRHFVSKGILASLFAGFLGATAAAELPAGTVISKANLDQVKNDTFEG